MPPPGAMPPGPESEYAPVAPHAETGASFIQPTGAAVATGRLAGSGSLQQPAKKEKKRFLQSLSR
jgi:hypothetical protein